MSHFIKCDRCSATIEMNDERFGLEWAALTDANDNSYAGRELPLHLCTDCTKAFNVWVKELTPASDNGSQPQTRKWLITPKKPLPTSENEPYVNKD